MLTDSQSSNIYDFSFVPIVVFSPSPSISCLQIKITRRNKERQEETNEECCFVYITPLRAYDT